ncbi:MAG: hypothetical protein KME67_05205 [Candidatus Thiodiazotropha sp. (ex Codakia orbicularis)]|nr:hypothetical protein [Candidatus Thiodiazotropha sp. (ex Codakia orbicularis)]
MYIDSFSNTSIVSLKKSLRHENGVLYALKYHPKVSTWDMAENAWLRKIIEALENKQLIVPVKAEYPWHEWKLTEAGNAAITV